MSTAIDWVRAFYQAMMDWERHAARMDSLTDNHYVDPREAEEQSKNAFFAIAEVSLADFDPECFLLHYSQPSSYDLADVISMQEPQHPHRVVVEHGQYAEAKTYVLPITEQGRIQGRYRLLSDGRMVGKLL